MILGSKSAIAFALLGLLTYQTSASASALHQNLPKAHAEVLTISQAQKDESTTKFVEVLSDHPGRATTLTAKQKSQIREILAKGAGNQNFVCTGLSLAGQRESRRSMQITLEM